MKTNKEMISEVTQQVLSHTSEMRRRKKAFASIAAVLTLFICLTAFAAASGKMSLFSDEWFTAMRQNILNAGDSVDAEDFRVRLEASTDRFSSDENYHVLMNYDTAEKIDQTIEKDGLVFYFDSVVQAEQMKNVRISGSIADADAVYEWQVFDAVYAILSVTVPDGMTDCDVSWKEFVDGYDPFTTLMCMEGDGQYSVQEGNTTWYAVNITDLAAFAGNGLVLVSSFFTGDVGSYEFANEYITADEDGVLSLTDAAPSSAVLFRFTLPKSWADKDVQKQLTEEQCMRKL